MKLLNDKALGPDNVIDLMTAKTKNEMQKELDSFTNYIGFLEDGQLQTEIDTLMKNWDGIGAHTVNIFKAKAILKELGHRADNPFKAAIYQMKEHITPSEL